MSIEKEIESLQFVMKQLEYQIKNTYERIIELKTDEDKSAFVDELQHQITMSIKMTESLKEENEKTIKLINKKISDTPDIIDSRPKIRYKPKKPPSYLVRKGEKWIRKHKDGTIEYVDIQPGEWD